MQKDTQLTIQPCPHTNEHTGKSSLLEYVTSDPLGDDATFATAWREGRALTIEQAIELALAGGQL